MKWFMFLFLEKLDWKSSGGRNSEIEPLQRVKSVYRERLNLFGDLKKTENEENE